MIALRRDLSPYTPPMFKFRSPGENSLSLIIEDDPDPIDPDFDAKYQYTEGYLDGPYDFAYIRIESYMNTSEASSANDPKYGMKAQTLSFAPGET